MTKIKILKQKEKIIKSYTLKMYNSKTVKNIFLIYSNNYLYLYIYKANVEKSFISLMKKVFMKMFIQ